MLGTKRNDAVVNAPASSFNDPLVIWSGKVKFDRAKSRSDWRLQSQLAAKSSPAIGSASALRDLYMSPFDC